MVLGTILYIVSIACFIWVLYDVWTQQNKMTTGKKVLWSVLSFFFSIIVAIVYYFVVKKK